MTIYISFARIAIVSIVHPATRKLLRLADVFTVPNAVGPFAIKF